MANSHSEEGEINNKNTNIDSDHTNIDNCTWMKKNSNNFSDESKSAMNMQDTEDVDGDDDDDDSVFKKEVLKEGGKKPLCCGQGPRHWCLKYFWEGQLFDDQPQATSSDTDDPEKTTNNHSWYMFFEKHRKFVGLVIPPVLMHLFWWSAVIKHNLWFHFNLSWFMSVTMAFASIIAGMTSEGGASIAFPVMTLALGIEPSTARDFSLLIQSAGMTSASITILIMGIQLEWNAIMWSAVGGAIGLILGLEFIDPQLTSAQKKMGFVSIWFSFAFALFLLNRYHKRPTFSSIQNMKIWKMCTLITVGFFGGIFSAVSGSGLDICTFSVLTLLFRISEKVATPTSIILMAVNSLVGFYWRAVIDAELSPEVWSYFIASVPVVVIGASVGSFFGSHFHRLVLASFVYITDSMGLISGFILVPQTTNLIITSLVIIFCGFIFFIILTLLGNHLMKHNKDHNYCDIKCIGVSSHFKKAKSSLDGHPA